jgi:hypothetical protein
VSAAKIVAALVVIGGLGGGAYAATSTDALDRFTEDVPSLDTPIPREFVEPAGTGAIVTREESTAFVVKDGVNVDVTVTTLSHLDPGRAVVREHRNASQINGNTDPLFGIAYTLLGEWADRDSYLLMSDERTWEASDLDPALILDATNVAPTVQAVIGFELAQRLQYQEVTSPETLLDAFGIAVPPLSRSESPTVPTGVTHEFRGELTFGEMKRLVPINPLQAWNIPAGYDDVAAKVLLGFDDQWILRWTDIVVELPAGVPQELAAAGGRPPMTRYRSAVETLDGEMPNVPRPVEGTPNEGFPELALEGSMPIGG